MIAVFSGKRYTPWKLIVVALLATAASSQAGAQIAVVPQWNPAYNWQGCYNGDAIYFSEIGEPPLCDAIDFFQKAVLHCESAVFPLENTGEYIGQLLAWREYAKNPDNSHWAGLDSNFSGRPIECFDDRGWHGEDFGIWYAANGTIGPWSGFPDGEPSWEITYYLFDGNYLNWMTFSPEDYNVTIDVRPGDQENKVNPSELGKLPVAILSSGTFDATQLDPATLQLGSGAAGIAEDVEIRNVDGEFGDDVIAKFRIQETGIMCEDPAVALSGATYLGDPFGGADLIDTSDCDSAGCHLLADGDIDQSI